MMPSGVTIAKSLSLFNCGGCCLALLITGSTMNRLLVLESAVMGWTRFNLWLNT